MINFKFNFVSQGYLEIYMSNLNKLFLIVFRISPCYEDFLVT